MEKVPQREVQMKKRSAYSGKFKSKVAIAAIEGRKTIAELASEFSLHPNHRTDLASSPWHSPVNFLVSGLRTDLSLVWYCIDRHGTWGVTVP